MNINEYEAMFLLENNAATADFEGTAGQVDAVLEKHGLTIVSKEKWDERKLAYEIKGQRRATYYLVYARGPAASMAPINEDLGLTEVVLRHMFIRLEEPIEQHVEKRAAEREALAEDSRRNSLTGWGGGRRDKRKGDRRSESGDAKPAEAKSDAGQPATATATAEKPAAAEAPKAEAPKAESPKAEPAAADAAATPEAAGEGDTN